MKHHPENTNIREKEMLLEAQVINGLMENRDKRLRKLQEVKQHLIGLPFEVSQELNQKIVEAA